MDEATFIFSTYKPQRRKEEKLDSQNPVVVYLVVLNAGELLDESTQRLSLSLRLIARGELGPVALSVKRTQQLK